MSEKLKEIARRCKGPVSLEYRDRAGCYEKLKDIVTTGEDDYDYYHESNFITPEDFNKCVETDEYWCLQFYPDTPVGFYYAFAHDMDALLNWGIMILDKNESGKD